jgi:hypothetical protein
MDGHVSRHVVCIGNLVFGGTSGSGDTAGYDRDDRMCIAAGSHSGSQPLKKLRANVLSSGERRASAPCSTHASEV